MAPPPRYQPLRALPEYEYAHVPRRNRRPTVAADGQVRGALRSLPTAPRDDHWADDAEYLWGVDLYNCGFFWEAHEVWEALWRDPERDLRQRRFLQALIQCAAACLKCASGNADACQRLSARALARLEGVEADRIGLYMGLDIARFIIDFRLFVDAQPTEANRRPLIALSSPP